VVEGARLVWTGEGSARLVTAFMKGSKHRQIIYLDDSLKRKHFRPDVVDSRPEQMLSV
jgi:hypothetical protein